MARLQFCSWHTGKMRGSLRKTIMQADYSGQHNVETPSGAEMLRRGTRQTDGPRVASSERPSPGADHASASAAAEELERARFLAVCEAHKAYYSSNCESNHVLDDLSRKRCRVEPGAVESRRGANSCVSRLRSGEDQANQTKKRAPTASAHRRGGTATSGVDSDEDALSSQGSSAGVRLSMSSHSSLGSFVENDSDHRAGGIGLEELLFEPASWPTQCGRGPAFDAERADFFGKLDGGEQAVNRECSATSSHADRMVLRADAVEPCKKASAKTTMEGAAEPPSPASSAAKTSASTCSGSGLGGATSPPVTPSGATLTPSRSAVLSVEEAPSSPGAAGDVVGEPAVGPSIFCFDKELSGGPSAPNNCNTTTARSASPRPARSTMLHHGRAGAGDCKRSARAMRKHRSMLFGGASSRHRLRGSAWSTTALMRSAWADGFLARRGQEPAGCSAVEPGGTKPEGAAAAAAADDEEERGEQDMGLVRGGGERAALLSAMGPLLVCGPHGGTTATESSTVRLL